jgi:nitrogen fixation/metabolism regulation signal transduction histidine kinase
LHVSSLKTSNDVGAICQAAMDDASSGHPECVFKLKSSGNLLGDFDSARLQQVFSNLLNNAAQYKGKNIL